MVDNVQIPKDVAKVFEIRDTSDPLRRFLTDLLIRLVAAEAKIVSLEARVTALEP